MSNDLCRRPVLARAIRYLLIRGREGWHDVVNESLLNQACTLCSHEHYSADDAATLGAMLQQKRMQSGSGWQLSDRAKSFRLTHSIPTRRKQPLQIVRHNTTPLATANNNKKCDDCFIFSKISIASSGHYRLSKITLARPKVLTLQHAVSRPTSAPRHCARPGTLDSHCSRNPQFRLPLPST
jgi:hypothetical protein